MATLIAVLIAALNLALMLIAMVCGVVVVVAFLELAMWVIGYRVCPRCDGLGRRHRIEYKCRECCSVW